MQSSNSAFVDNFVSQRLTSPTTINPSSAISSFAAYAFNYSGNGSGYNQNTLTLSNKTVCPSSVAQFLNQSIYEPIEDDNYSNSTNFPNPETIASAFNYDYYQSQTCMDRETCNSFESNNLLQQEKSISKNLADVAEAHEQNLKLFRESFDLDGMRQPLENNLKKKHKKSKR